MSLSLGILSLCLLLLTGSIIALCFHRLRPKAKWAASASASGFTVSLLLLGLSFDREAQQLGLVVKEICPCAEQAEVTNSTRKEEAAEGKEAEHEARRLTGVEVRQRAKLAVTEEAQARRRVEVARIEEAEARQQAKLAGTEETEARRRAEVARTEEAEARRQPTWPGQKKLKRDTEPRCQGGGNRSETTLRCSQERGRGGQSEAKDAYHYSRGA